ncbi:MAG: alpha/beta fold hydrolase [Saccharolobus sp.]|uniref:alpha/beta fold hydrolase n=1 Tax=Saccharolobus TaxID=2100760 RepID=UPI001F0DB03A|nr:alpha/beta fold hydrolase [Saccharolobus shibatae]MCH4815189.1 lysophospholipase [Saccharolobus shibatae]
MYEQWKIVKSESPILGNEQLVENIWKMKREGSPYDVISLHKVNLRDGGNEAILVLPGTWSSGEQLVTISWHGVYYTTPDFKKSIVLYLARNGFNVYTIDYRTHYVPPFLKDKQLSFMANWGWSTWINDIKEVVSFIKRNSNQERIFLAGESFGGGAALNYSSLYWRDDIKGLILLDGGPVKHGIRPRFYTPEVSSIEEMEAKGIYAIPSRGGPNNPIWAYALANPDMPSPDPKYKTISDFLMDSLYISGSANPYDYPYSKKEDVFPILASFDPYWPYRLSLERGLKFDYKGILVPTIAFFSERFGLQVFDSERLPPNSEVISLKGYGHLDVYTGLNPFSH